jgi:small-conductance mechanosensitive channel
MTDGSPDTQIAPHELTENRIAWLTLCFGLLAAVLVAVFYQPLWAFGLAVGAVLAWLNFRWLKRGLDALTAAATAQSGSANPRVPLSAYFGGVFRYGLIAIAVYVIFIYLKVPVLSMIAGLCSLGAATVAASLYEILHPSK